MNWFAVLVFLNIFFNLGTTYIRDDLAANYWLCIPVYVLLLAWGISYLRSKRQIAALGVTIRYCFFFSNFVFAQSLMDSLLGHYWPFWRYYMGLFWVLASFAIAIQVFRKMVGFDRVRADLKLNG